MKTIFFIESLLISLDLINDLFCILFRVSSTRQKTTDKNGKEITLTNAQYTAQLQARGLEKLSEAAKTETFEGDVDFGAYTYRTDYDVGDLVTIRDRHGITANARIVAVEEIEDGDGYTVSPTFSDFTITDYSFEEAST